MNYRKRLPIILYPYSFMYRSVGLMGLLDCKNFDSTLFEFLLTFTSLFTFYCSNTAEKFDPANQEWRTIASMNTRRSSVSNFSIFNFILVLLKAIIIYQISSFKGRCRRPKRINLRSRYGRRRRIRNSFQSSKGKIVIIFSSFSISFIRWLWRGFTSLFVISWVLFSRIGYLDYRWRYGIWNKLFIAI